MANISTQTHTHTHTALAMIAVIVCTIEQVVSVAIFIKMSNIFKYLLQPGIDCPQPTI